MLFYVSTRPRHTQWELEGKVQGVNVGLLVESDPPVSGVRMLSGEMQHLATSGFSRGEGGPHKVQTSKRPHAHRRSIHQLSSAADRGQAIVVDVEQLIDSECRFRVSSPQSTKCCNSVSSSPSSQLRVEAMWLREHCKPSNACTVVRSSDERQLPNAIASKRPKEAPPAGGDHLM